MLQRIFDGNNNNKKDINICNYFDFYGLRIAFKAIKWLRNGCYLFYVLWVIMMMIITEEIKKNKKI